jgi:hypothetical protein
MYEQVGLQSGRKEECMKPVPNRIFQRPASPKMSIAYLLTLLLIAFSAHSQTEKTGRGALSAQEISPTPPMGWNSWNHFHNKVDDATIRAQAEAMVSSGMRDAGYIYLNIDDTLGR